MSTGTNKDRCGLTTDRWSDELAAYLENQSAVNALRENDMPEFPWSDADNPMLAYLVQRSDREIAFREEFRELAQHDGRSERGPVRMQIAGYLEPGLG